MNNTEAYRTFLERERERRAERRELREQRHRERMALLKLAEALLVLAREKEETK